ERVRATEHADPWRAASAALVAAAVADASARGLPPTLGLAAAGGLFCGRHALRGGHADLLVGAALLDAGAMVLALGHQRSDPLPYVAPVSLSALIVAQRLRGTLSPDAVTAIRYAAAGALYVTCFGQGLFDPVYTSVLIALAVAGIAAGELARVRSFLRLGLGF